MSDLDNMELSDRLPEAMHPVETPLLYGHRPAIARLEESLSSGRFHHGWIFAGPHGVGKATLCYHLARVLIGVREHNFAPGFDLLALSETLRQEKAGRLIANFSHPDMRVLRRAYDPKGKKFFRFIRVDEIRALKNFLHTTPSMGPHRVVLVDAAEDMNAASANALLKVLEEPPAHTTFLLVSNAPGQIPITIRSRCRMLKMGELSAGEFEAAICQQLDATATGLPTGVNWQDLMHLAGGSARQGIELITGNGLKFYQALYKIFDHLPNIDERNVDLFVTGVLKDKSGQDYEAGVQLISDMIHRLVKGHAAAYPLSAGEKKLSDKLIGAQSIEHWLGLWDTLNRMSLDVDDLNLDKKTHLMQCFFSLRDVARGDVARVG